MIFTLEGSPVLNESADTSSDLSLNHSINYFNSSIKRLINEQTELLNEFVNDYSTLCDQPTYISEMVLNESEKKNLGQSLKNIWDKLSEGFNRFIQKAISLFDQLFRNYDKFISQNKDKIIKNANLIGKDFTINGYKYNIISGSNNAMDRINDVIKNTFKDYSDTDVLEDETIKGTLDSVERDIIYKLIGTRNLSDFEKNANEFLRGKEMVKLTLNDLGGIDNIIKNITDAKNVQDKLKKIKKDFNNFMRDLNITYEYEDDEPKDPARFAAIQKAYTVIMKYLNICISNLRDERNQSFQICKQLANAKIPEERGTKPVSEIT